MKNYTIKEFNLGPGTRSASILNARGDKELGLVAKYRPGGDWEIFVGKENIGFLEGTKRDVIETAKRAIFYGKKLCVSMARCHADGDGGSTIGFGHGVPTCQVMRCVEAGKLWITLDRKKEALANEKRARTGRIAAKKAESVPKVSGEVQALLNALYKASAAHYSPQTSLTVHDYVEKAIRAVHAAEMVMETELAAR